MCRLRVISSALTPGVGRDRTEAQRIEHRDRTRAHGENVAQDSAHAGGRALKRLNKTRMVVRLDFENGDEAVADIDHAGIFAGTLHHVRAARGQALQVRAARFVGAVLAPHHAENAQLGDVGVAAENFLDAGKFVGCEAVLGGDLWRDFDFGFDGGHRQIQKRQTQKRQTRKFSGRFLRRK